MPVYDQSAAPDTLGYNFEAYQRPGEPWDSLHVVGSVPEPSDDAVEKLFQEDLPLIRAKARAIMQEWLADIRKTRLEWMRENGKPEPADGEVLDSDVPSDMLVREQESYAEHVRRSRQQSRAATLDAWAEFCQGSPSRELLAALPYRAFQHWTGWMTGQFSPEALAAGTSI